VREFIQGEKKMDNVIATNKREVFIAINRLTKGSQPLFVGPFRNIDEAQMVIDQAISDNQEIVMDNGKPATKTALKAEILGKTEARKLGMRSENMGDKINNLYPEIPEYNTWDHIVVEEKPHRGRPRKDTTVANVTPVKEIKKAETKTRPSGFVEMQKAPSGGNRVVIVTRYSGMVEWLARKGIKGEIISDVYHPRQIENAYVIGNLNGSLLINVAAFGIINMPHKDKKLVRGQNLTPDEMDEYGAKLRWFSAPKEIESPIK
jgi:putative CRISPR-associated protein (TIGR02620 family)